VGLGRIQYDTVFTYAGYTLRCGSSIISVFYLGRISRPPGTILIGSKDPPVRHSVAHRYDACIEQLEMGCGERAALRGINRENH
jgi:hypothetical protein